MWKSNWKGDWQPQQAILRFSLTSDELQFDSKVVFKVQKFTPQYHLISYVFPHNLKPKKGSNNELRHSDLFFLDEMVYQDMPYTSPLPSIIISYMRTVGRSKARDTCFGFPWLLMMVFETVGVHLRGCIEHMWRA